VAEQDIVGSGLEVLAAQGNHSIRLGNWGIRDVGLEKKLRRDYYETSFLKSWSS
jgi:hypothetical protein